MGMTIIIAAGIFAVVSDSLRIWLMIDSAVARRRSRRRREQRKLPSPLVAVEVEDMMSGK